MLSLSSSTISSQTSTTALVWCVWWVYVEMKNAEKWTLDFIVAAYALDKWCTTTKHDIISQFYVQFSDFPMYARIALWQKVRKFIYIYVCLFEAKKNEIHMKIDGWRKNSSCKICFVLHRHTTCSLFMFTFPFNHPPGFRIVTMDLIIWLPSITPFVCVSLDVHGVLV